MINKKNGLITFGDPENIGIIYQNGKDGQNFNQKIYIIINGIIIGNPNECNMISSWIYSLDNFYNNIKLHFDQLWHVEFEGKSDLEIFEMLIKSNQLVKDHNLHYFYLPVLPNYIWTNCKFNLDETIDDYLIFVIKRNEKLVFMWKGPFLEDIDNEDLPLNSFSVDRFTLLDILSNCINTIKSINKLR